MATAKARHLVARRNDRRSGARLGGLLPTKWAAGLAATGLVAALALLGIWLARGIPEVPHEAPEAEKILAAQADMPFQILIPAYLPREFDRAGVEIDIRQSGPGGEPMVQLVYRTARGVTLFVRQWVPVNPQSEILAASRPIQTKWGQGWLLMQGTDLGVVWVDVGPLRVSVYTRNLDVISREELLEMAETLGPASNRQVFSFVVDPPTISEAPPPPPLEVEVNAEGVQEITLVVTPGGYSPVRFAVRKGIPVRLTFRMLGQVGCGNTLIFPVDAQHTSALKLESESDTKVLEFTPQAAGNYEFHCTHLMYRGVMVVRE